VSGDRTQHVLWRLDHGHFEGFTPKVVVLMIGTNNSNGDDNTVTEIADGVRAIVGRIRAKSPTTKILLLDIFPRGETPNPQRGKNCQVNQLLAKLDDGNFVHYHPIGHLFLDDAGKISKDIMPDFLHLTERGYEIWAAAIEEKLDALMNEVPE
ncbi:MAG: GDSL-type esterase/lipase family protein, partial [Phycisphaerae bacterium]